MPMGLDYIVPCNPATNTNPGKPHVMWLNSVSGELFVCVDATQDSNDWRGQRGTTISL